MKTTMIMAMINKQIEIEEIDSEKETKPYRITARSITSIYAADAMEQMTFRHCSKKF